MPTKKEPPKGYKKVRGNPTKRPKTLGEVNKKKESLTKGATGAVRNLLKKKKK